MEAPVHRATSPQGGWKLVALELFVSVATVALFLMSCWRIRVNPRDRLGQVSGISSLELRFFVAAGVLIGALLLARYVRGGRAFEPVSRLVCAAIAGLAGAIMGGGIMVALYGTPYGLNAWGGDAGFLIKSAMALHNGEPINLLYPPLSIQALHWYSDLTQLPPEFAIKHLQIFGTAAFGPVAYLSWRLLFRPGWALAIGVVAMLPLVEPYKPYPNLVLVAFVPLAILFLETLRDADTRTRKQIVIASVSIGATLGILCMLYSGWFQWSVPGMLVAIIALAPWKRARTNVLLMLGITGAVFLAVASPYWVPLILDPTARVVDNYVYFDSKTEPMYIAIWRNDMGGPLEQWQWPPIGELGGVGVYTLLLTAGLGLAIAVGRKKTLVVGLGLIMFGAFLMRFWYAHLMWETKLVQLYPRTTALICYGLIVTAIYAVYLLVQRLSVEHPLRGSSGLTGGLVALLFLFASAGSSTADRFMPMKTEPPTAGYLAWNAHQTYRAMRGPIYYTRVMSWIRRTPE